MRGPFSFRPFSGSSSARKARSVPHLRLEGWLGGRGQNIRNRTRRHRTYPCRLYRSGGPAIAAVDELLFDFQRRSMSVVVDCEGDHAKVSAMEAIELLTKAGVKVKVLTGEMAW